MMLIQDEKEEEAKTLINCNKPAPGLHGLLRQEREVAIEMEEEEGVASLLRDHDSDDIDDEDEQEEMDMEQDGRGGSSVL
jgi:hypothetical protein